MSASKAQKRKNKKKYFQSTKKSKCASLEPDMRGFLITCNDEPRCVREAYNLLNEFADEMYGPEFQQAADEQSEDIDIKDQLAKEIAAIKSKRRFQQVFVKVKGVLFINTTVPEPASLVDKIFETVIKNGKRKTRFILKLKPVFITCKSYESEIRKALDDILLQYVSEEKNRELTYKVECKVTHNDNITSSHFIRYVRDSLESISAKWTASILEPQVMISFYVLQTVCCISILDRYEEYKKYNLSNVVALDNENSVCPIKTEDTKVPETLNESKNVDEIMSGNNVEKSAD